MVANIGIPAEEIKGMCVHYLRFYKDSPLWWHEQGFFMTAHSTTWIGNKLPLPALHPFYLKHGDKILSVLELPGRNEDGDDGEQRRLLLQDQQSEFSQRTPQELCGCRCAVHGHAWNGHPHRHDALYGIEMQDLYVSYLRGENGYAPKNVWFVRPVVWPMVHCRAQMRTTKLGMGKR